MIKEKVDLKEKRIIPNKKLIFTVVALLLALILIFCTVGHIKGLFSSGDKDAKSGFELVLSKNVRKAMELEAPDWVDKQIINIHSTARTGTKLRDINNIVIHYVGNPDSTAQNNREYFNKASTGVSSHFIVGLEGEIIQCVPVYEKSAASNNRNSDTISIEVCHPDETGRFNEETYNSVIKLCVWLCDEFSLDETEIIRHYDITGKNCPKYYVENPSEWEEFCKDVKEGLDKHEK